MNATISGFVAIPYLAIQLFITYRNDGHTFVTNSNTAEKNNKPEDYNALENFTTFSSKLSFSNPV